MLRQTHQIGVGTLVHRRFLEPAHEFRYAMRQVLVDLTELDALCARTRWWSSSRFALGWFRRADFLDQPDKPFMQRLREIVAQRLHIEFDGPAMMLVAPRCWGVCFNPLTLYFCFDRDNKQPKAVVAEVHNTPWFERHLYVIDLSDPAALSHGKAFHVSPFLPMDMDYHWQFNLNPEQLRITISNHRDGQRVFDAVLWLRLHDITATQLDRELWTHLPQSFKTLCGIYWQALRLMIKRARFYTYRKQ